MAISTVSLRSSDFSGTSNPLATAIILFNDMERKIAEGVVHRMVKRAVEMEGTVTGEHGVGLVKRDYLEHELGETTVDAMRRVSVSGSLNCYYVPRPMLTEYRQIKLALDPLRLLNCDKVIRTERPMPGELKKW